MTHKMKGKRNGSTHKIRSKLDDLATHICSSPSKPCIF